MTYLHSGVYQHTRILFSEVRQAIRNGAHRFHRFFKISSLSLESRDHVRRPSGSPKPENNVRLRQWGIRFVHFVDNQHHRLAGLSNRIRHFDIQGH